MPSAARPGRWFAGCLLLLLGVFGVHIPTALACSCAPLEPGAELELAEAAELVFVGSLSSVHNWRSRFNRRVRLDVGESLKGPGANTVVLWTRKSGAECGAHFEADQTYLVFASRNDGKLWTDLCSVFQVRPELEQMLRSLRDRFVQR